MQSTNQLQHNYKKSGSVKWKQNDVKENHDEYLWKNNDICNIFQEKKESSTL